MRAAAVMVVALFATGCAHQAPPPPPPPKPVVEAPPAPKPEPTDDVKMSGGMGQLSDEEIAAPFQRRWDDITHCYEDATAKLSYLGGKIEVKLRVAASGDPKSVFVVSSTFGNYDAERCIVSVARELHFAKPHGAGNEAEFSYPIEFKHKRPVQSWDEQRVSPGVAKHKHDVTSCAAKTPNGVPPALTMTMYVAPGGKVTSAGISADTPVDDAFARCVVGKSKLWRFADPLGTIAKATVGVAE